MPRTDTDFGPIKGVFIHNLQLPHTAEVIKVVAMSRGSSAVDLTRATVDLTPATFECVHRRKSSRPIAFDSIGELIYIMRMFGGLPFSWDRFSFKTQSWSKSNHHKNEAKGSRSERTK